VRYSIITIIDTYTALIWNTAKVDSQTRMKRCCIKYDSQQETINEHFPRRLLNEVKC